MKSAVIPSLKMQCDTEIWAYDMLIFLCSVSSALLQWFSDMFNEKKKTLTDLHCHILPGIDDGAKDLDTAVALLKEQKSQGVEQIVFTPHFWSWEKSLCQFALDRYHAAEKLADILDELGIEWGAGAEVRMTPDLLKMDLKSLNIVGTPYFLLEWPFTQFPLYGREVVDRIQELDYTPVFAHIERYDYFWNSPKNLDEYIDEGIVCQINPGILLKSETRKYALKMIKDGYVHVLSSDAHNMENRPPHLKLAFQIVEKNLGKKYAEKLKTNADLIFHGKEI